MYTDASLSLYIQPYIHTWYNQLPFHNIMEPQENDAYLYVHTYVRTRAQYGVVRPKYKDLVTITDIFV